MERLWRYYGNYQGLRGDMGGLPGWAKVILMAALPGAAAVALSLLALLVSIFLLLLLTVPLYRLLRGLVGARPAHPLDVVVEQTSVPVRPGARRVEATVIDVAGSWAPPSSREPLPGDEPPPQR